MVWCSLSTACFTYFPVWESYCHMTTLSLCCQLFGFTFKFLNLFLQFNCNFYIRLGGQSTLAGSTSSFYRIWFVSFTDHLQEVFSCLFGLLGPGSSTCGMGVYRGGQGAAFTTSMRLWHLQRQKFLPAQAQSFRCFPSHVTKQVTAVTLRCCGFSPGLGLLVGFRSFTC